MEVLLQGTQGVSSDSVISIRAGNTRRQVPLAMADRPFKFPCKLEECGSIKVDFMNVTACARAVIHPEGEQEFKLKLATKSAPAKVELADGGEVSLLVRPAGAVGKETPAAESLAAAVPGNAEQQSRESRKKAAAKSTERYLEEHGVLTFLQGLLQGIIKDKPADPYSFVAQQFAATVPTPPVPPTLPPPRGLPQVLQEDPGQPPLKSVPAPKQVLQKSSEQKQGQPSEIEQLRQQARDALLAGAQSGKLFEVLQKSSEQKQGRPDEIEQLRQQARDALLAGAQSGKLLEVLQKSSEQKAGQPDEIEQLRQQARDALLAGAQSGKLLEVLQKRSEQKQRQPDELEQLRQQARDALLAGAQSGKLLEVLQTSSEHHQGQPDEMEQLRQQARDALLAGAQSGKLLEVLQKSSEQKQGQPDEIEQLRQQARDDLLAGAQSGKLLEVLQKSSEQKQGQLEDEAVHLGRQTRVAVLQSGEFSDLEQKFTDNSLHEQPNGPESEEPAFGRTQDSQSEQMVHAVQELHKMAEEKAHLEAEQACLEGLLRELEQKNAILRCQAASR